MTTTPNDQSWENDSSMVQPTGTYWTPPVAISVDELDPLVQNAIELRLDNVGEADPYDIYVAGAFDMASCAPEGEFIVAIDRNNGRARGIYRGESLGKPAQLSFDGDIDVAFAELYERTRDQGYVL
jgi:hypothetical protein